MNLTMYCCSGVFLCSNGIGHRLDETEYDETPTQITAATEAAEPQEMTQEQEPAVDDGTEQTELLDEPAKPLEDGTEALAEQGPMVDQCQEQITSEQERPTEVEEVQPEVEGIRPLFVYSLMEQFHVAVPKVKIFVFRFLGLFSLY